MNGIDGSKVQWGQVLHRLRGGVGNGGGIIA